MKKKNTLWRKIKAFILWQQRWASRPENIKMIYEMRQRQIENPFWF